MRIRNIFCKFAVQKKNPMIRKIVILFAVSLWAATSFAQQDTIVTPRPEELTVDSISSDSVSNQDTIYIVQHGHHHGKKAHFKGYESMHKKAVKRRHKVQKQNGTSGWLTHTNEPKHAHRRTARLPIRAIPVRITPVPIAPATPAEEDKNLKKHESQVGK